MVKMDAACARAIEVLGDLREQCLVKRKLCKLNEISIFEYIGYLSRYKALHDALHDAHYPIEEFNPEGLML